MLSYTFYHYFYSLKEAFVTALEETHHVGDSAGLREHWH